MRLALILNAIDPSIGGVLICGRRGTGKSTAVRALPSLLPPLSGVADCPYFCDPAASGQMCSTCRERSARGEGLPLAIKPVPLVTLPLNASEDRVAGGIDLSNTLEQGSSIFAPGLLAAAHRGILYIDEINLLGDHIIDLLLDAAALGVNRIERDGISLAHPARFVLIGTMNPEEGTLRSQLLDRIGLYVEAEDVRDPAARTEVVERRLTFDRNPDKLIAHWEADEQALRARILQARSLLHTVRIASYYRQVIAFLVDRQLHAQGHRGDLVVLRTARALAAYEQRTEVQREDIERAVELAMPHRARSTGDVVRHLSRAFERIPATEAQTTLPEEIAMIDEDLDSDERDEREGPAGLSRPLRGDDDRHVQAILQLVQVARDRLVRQEAGRRFVSLTRRHSGRALRSRQQRPVSDIGFSATIRAAAPHQRARGRRDGERLVLHVDDLRQKVRERKTRALLIFVVDGSDSVMARHLMARTKRILLALMQQAYEKRDRVALLVFRFAQGRLVLPPTRNFTRARRSVEELYIGGCTPLATGLLEGLRLAESERLRDPTVRPILVILTDAIGNVDLSGNMRHDTPRRDALNVAAEIARHRITTIMLDTNPYDTVTDERGEQQPAPGRELADALAADYHQYDLPYATTLLKRR
jgi:magnesium chelatase subunit D